MDLSCGLFDIFDMSYTDFTEVIDSEDSVTCLLPREPHDASGGFHAGDHKNAFDNVPEEILRHVFHFLSGANLFTVADVCKRFRDAACQEIRHFEMDEMFPCNKKEKYAGRLIVRLVNLRSLDLSALSCGNFLSKNTDVTGFASSLASSCRKIEHFTLTGQRGARILRVYVNSLGAESKVKQVSLDIQRAAIGCATSLKPVCQKLNLTTLTLSSSLSIRRCSRTRDVLSQLFAQLLPGIPCLTLRFVETDTDITSLAVSHTSGLRQFSVNNISDDCVVTLAQRNPDIDSLQMVANSDSLKRLCQFKKLQWLWIHVPADEHIEAEDVEQAFAAQPLKSQLRFLSVRGFLSSDPLLGICLLSHLEALVVDCSQLLYEDWDHSYKRMLRLKHLTVLTNFSVSISTTAPAESQRSSADVLSLFPNLEVIRFTDCEFSVKDNFAVRRFSISEPNDKRFTFPNHL